MVRKNDNDYDARKWSNFRPVDMGQKNPRLTNNGSFKRRAYHLHYRGNTAFRLQAIEMKLDLGSI